ncbi:hypothetical protein V6N13_077409 [Hibiscus sabdariffa]
MSSCTPKFKRFHHFNNEHVGSELPCKIVEYKLKYRNLEGLHRFAHRYSKSFHHFPPVFAKNYSVEIFAVFSFLEKFKTPVVIGSEPDKEILKMVARTTLRTKLYEGLADQLTDIVVNVVLGIRKADEPIDLFMVEIMHMRHKFDVDTRLLCLYVCFILHSLIELNFPPSATNVVKRALVALRALKSKYPGLQGVPVDSIECYALSILLIESSFVCIMELGFFCFVSTLVEGLVLDHGSRHPDMKRRAENCYILTCNVSLEYEKRERQWLQLKGAQLMKETKNKVCADTESNFVVINQKGIDPPSLHLLQQAGLVSPEFHLNLLISGFVDHCPQKSKEKKYGKACGGEAVNSVDDLTPDRIGWAGLVYEHVLGEDKYTFVENVRNPHSCTILIKGSDDHAIAQIKDAVRDGLRAVKNTIEDEAVVLGAGAFEVAARQYLINAVKKTVRLRAQLLLGVEAFADGLLVVPKTLAENAGLDTQDVIIGLMACNCFTVAVGG